MTRYQCVIEIWDSLPAGPLSNPTPSLILGVPTGGGIGVGCVITVPGRPDLPSGLVAEAVLDVLHDEAEAHLTPTMPLWYGRVIGEARNLKPTPPQPKP